MANQVCFVVVSSSLGLIISYLADDPKEVIIAAARRLDHQQARHGCFGVQFVQIGDDPDATEALREMDDDLPKLYGVRVCRNHK
jgi:hypothetical protein